MPGACGLLSPALVYIYRETSLFLHKPVRASAVPVDGQQQAQGPLALAVLVPAQPRLGCCFPEQRSRCQAAAVCGPSAARSQERAHAALAAGG